MARKAPSKAAPKQPTKRRNAAKPKAAPKKRAVRPKARITKAAIRAFALVAPPEPQSWFEPKGVGQRPTLIIQDANGQTFDNPDAAEFAVLPTRIANGAELAAWERNYRRQRAAQWPFAWARAVLQSARERYQL